MQNFSMSSALGEGDVPAVSQAQDVLLQYAIPAARKANVQIIWLNWGLDESDLETLTPATMRVFGWTANCDSDDHDIFNSSLIAAGVEKMDHCGEVPSGRGDIPEPSWEKLYYQTGRKLMPVGP
jgi:hypothetical protein